MPVLRKDGVVVAVPDSVADDYVAQGWTSPTAEPTVDDTWTVARLRQRARATRVRYKGLSKAELLEALR